MPDRYPMEFLSAWPALYHGVLRPHPGQAKIWEDLARHARACFTAAPPASPVTTGGALLLGQTGRGKTALAALLARLFDAKLHVPVRLIRCADLRLKLRNFRARDDDTPDVPDIVEAASPANAPLLVIDDVGVERGVPDAEEVVRALVDARTLAPCFTAWTSNLAENDLFAYLGGERMDSRMAFLEVFVLDSQPDYRRSRP